MIAHPGTLDFVTAKEHVVFLGPPGTGKTHLAIGLAIRSCQAGHRVAFATTAEWVSRLAEAHHAGRLQAELIKLGRVPAAGTTGADLEVAASCRAVRPHGPAARSSSTRASRRAMRLMDAR